MDDGSYSLVGFQNFIKQHNEGIKQSGITAKAAAIGHSLLNAAISMGISLLVSWAISAVTRAINANEELAKSAEEAISKYQDAQTTLNKQKKTINELSNSYERLSKGVNLDTNENINLTTSSYQEYLNICNDIADMYPHLVTGFDAQGNAILSLKGNVDELIQAMQKSQKHMAIVIDEFGGTTGLVTMEDALEEMVIKLFCISKNEKLELLKIFLKHLKITMAKGLLVFLTLQVLNII